MIDETGKFLAHDVIYLHRSKSEVEAAAMTLETLLQRHHVRAIAIGKPGMVLEGVVTNVTKFGAFVDIGVHQDGLVHISELSKRYVKDASDIVKAGQIVKVKVLSADPRTKRIALSIKALQESRARVPPKQEPEPVPRQNGLVMNSP